MDRGDSDNSADEARDLALGLVGYFRSTNKERGLDAAARAVGISKWSLWALYHGRRKTVGYGVLAALRREYLRIMERQLVHLEAQIRGVRERSGEDDALTDLGSEATRLVARLQASRQRQGP